MLWPISKVVDSDAGITIYLYSGGMRFNQIKSITKIKEG